MAKQSAQQQIAVIGAKGERAIVVATPNPQAPIDEAEIVYGIDGLAVEKISAHEFRDFRGMIWTIDVA